ncbi:hypothetical protein BGZ73_002239 [Actinomortierella ambigua]|nr:hypothetical protein BGZ73_002239 [Actinomortierella ambigua]
MASITLTRFVGAGGYGSVYFGRWGNRRVAAKKFNITMNEEKTRDAILREVHLLKSLQDRYIIQYYDLACHENNLVLVMDYAEGGSLKTAIEKRRLPDWSTRTRIAQEIVCGIDYMHEKGVLHGDLKSANVLLTRYMEVRLCDFGFATATSIARSAEDSGSLRGSLRWMAPELFASQPRYSTKSDMYAYGIVLWEMASGCTIPFEDESDNSKIASKVKSGMREVIPDDIPSEYSEYRSWIERCWKQDPHERPEAVDLVPRIDELETEDGESSEDDALSISLSFSNDFHEMSISSTPATSEKPNTPSQHDTHIPSPTDVDTVAGNTPVPAEPTKNQPVATQCKDVDVLLPLAESGDHAAQAALGELYEQGNQQVDKNLQKALKWYQRAAEGGHAQAQFRLGDLSLHGQGVPQSDVDAFQWFQMAAEQGSVDAQMNLAKMYNDGRGLAKDLSSAFQWYQKAALQSNTDAQYCLGCMYRDGQGVAQNYTQAVTWFLEAVKQEDAAAMCAVGEMYRQGHGVEQNDVEAISFFRKSALQGNALGQYSLGEMLLFGLGDHSERSESTMWFKRAAMTGHASAQYRLASAFYYGHGVTRNEVQAASWCRKAAEQNHRDAQYFLGSMYLDGQGVDVNETIAASWIRKAADQGSVDAQLRLAKMYDEGRGVGKNVAESRVMYRKAADQGRPEAQLIVGKMYEAGEGVEQSDTEAVKWYRLAAEQFDPRAQMHLGLMDIKQAALWYREAAAQGESTAEYSLKRLYGMEFGGELADADNGCVSSLRQAAAQGNANAMYDLGWCLEKGKGVEQNIAEAVEWYLKAAEHGSLDAKMKLGEMHQNGQGVPMDYRESIYWFGEAAAER